MTRQDQTTALDQITELLSEHGFYGMAQAVVVLLNEVMKLERTQVLGAGPYQRAEGRTGYANGFKSKTLHTRLGTLTVEIPQTRGVEFYPSALEKGVRSERALKLAVAEMYVQGVSTRKVAAITETLCGLEVTSSQVSRAAAALDGELDKWRNRPLGETPYLILDARLREGPPRSSDAHAGLKPALDARLSGVPWQRCQFHLMKNALAFVPKPSLKPQVVASIRAVFDAPDRLEAGRQLEIAVKT
jgi:putative transposase